MLRPGDVVTCKVAKLSQFGIIVEVEGGIRGIIHITELAEPPWMHPQELVHVGEMIQAEILHIEHDKNTAGLSRRRVTQS
jgi:ribosomal protein S1